MPSCGALELVLREKAGGGGRLVRYRVVLPAGASGRVEAHLGGGLRADRSVDLLAMRLERAGLTRGFGSARVRTQAGVGGY